jgi:competence ComEA-like helix-hairpin-helix protein
MAHGVCAGSHERAGDMIRSVWFATLACISVVAGLALAIRTAGTSVSQAPLALEDKVNPNDASLPSLARLPGIGPARARAIVSYRSQVIERGGGGPAFSCAEDLRRIAGIGPATVEAIRPWLRFDSRPADGQVIAGQRP